MPTRRMSRTSVACSRQGDRFSAAARLAAHQARGQHHCGGAVGDQQADGGAGHAQAGYRAPAEDQRRAQHQVDQRRQHQQQRRQQHVARAAHHGAQHVGGPDDDGAAEQHVGIGQRRVERRAAPAHGRVHAAAEAEQHERERGRQHAGDEQRLLRQAAGLIAAPGAQRACDGGGDGTADAAARHLHHQHRQRKDQRDARQRVGAQLAEDVAVVADDDRHREQADRHWAWPGAAASAAAARAASAACAMWQARRQAWRRLRRRA